MLLEIIAQLKTVPGLKLVQPAIALEAIGSLPQYPAALVYPFKETGSEQLLSTQASRQTFTAMYAVVLACEVTEWEALRAAVKLALIGKTLDEAAQVDELIFVEGEVMDVTAGRIWWRDAFGYRTSTRY